MRELRNEELIAVSGGGITKGPTVQTGPNSFTTYFYDDSVSGNFGSSGFNASAFGSGNGSFADGSSLSDYNILEVSGPDGHGVCWAADGTAHAGSCDSGPPLDDDSLGEETQNAMNEGMRETEERLAAEKRAEAYAQYIQHQIDSQNAINPEIAQQFLDLLVVLGPAANGVFRGGVIGAAAFAAAQDEAKDTGFQQDAAEFP